MLSALKRAGKSVELITLKHEDHWLSHGELGYRCWKPP